jgi:hypothetical protein
VLGGEFLEQLEQRVGHARIVLAGEQRAMAAQRLGQQQAAFELGQRRGRRCARGGEAGERGDARAEQAAAGVAGEAAAQVRDGGGRRHHDRGGGEVGQVRPAAGDEVLGEGVRQVRAGRQQD